MIKYKTCIEIAKDLNITSRAVAYRLKALDITGRKIINTVYYNENEIKKISFKKYLYDSNPIFTSANKYQNKVDIIEMHLQLDERNAAQISRTLKLPVRICEHTIKEFTENQCIIIQSKL